MKIILCILLLAAPMPPASVQRAIIVVLAEPPGETFTADERADALAKLDRAMTWWEKLSPNPTTIYVDRVYTGTELIDGDENTIVFTVVDNSDTHITLSGVQGITLLWDDAAYPYVTTSATEAVYTHELGHAVYRLPDFYAMPGACTGIDIMCLTTSDAYVSRFIGCASLAFLGKPCQHTYLPLMVLSR